MSLGIACDAVLQAVGCSNGQLRDTESPFDRTAALPHLINTAATAAQSGPAPLRLPVSSRRLGPGGCVPVAGPCGCNSGYSYDCTAAGTEWSLGITAARDT
eukprot:1741827-Rhodomonas_salina.2